MGGGDSIRRPGNTPLPKLESKPQHQKKNVAHAHDGGVIAVIKAIPEEQSWQQIKEKIRGKLPEKVQLWFVSEVSEKNTCIIASAPFEGDFQLFEQMEIEVGGVKLKTEVAQGDLLQQSLKVLPKHIKDKREKEARKRQKERNRPIVVGGLRFVNVTALRTDYKLIKSLLDFHPKGSEKSKGMVGIKVAKSSQGDTRCFWMVKDDGKEEDFSAQKCLSAVEANPPYVEDPSSKKKGPAPLQLRRQRRVKRKKARSLQRKRLRRRARSLQRKHPRRRRLLREYYSAIFWPCGSQTFARSPD